MDCRGCLASWFVSTPFGSSLLVGPIARGFHSIQDPREAASAAAIVVLSGGTNDVTARSDAIARPSDTTALRTLEAARVFRLLDGRPLVVASGGTPHARQRTPEGRVIADALVALRVPIDHIVVEDASLTTHDQAIIVTRLLESRGIRRFVLVTSPTHMRRSVAAFRAQHADVIPSAAPLTSDNIKALRFFVPNNESLRLSDGALYDYLGTAYYWARGWFRPVPGSKDPMKVLVVGANGQLGSAVAREFSRHADVVAWGRAELDITDDASVRAKVTAEAPTVIVNCAAYNRVDAAEDDPVTALNVNAFGVRALARATAVVGATLVHYSSDFVFDGRTDRPYTESDRPNPQSVYGASKLVGEWFAADAPRWYVLRVESLFGPLGNGERRGSAATILERVIAGHEVPVFVDRTVSPTYVVDTAAATRAVIERGLPSGVYHCVNSGQCTWWAFAEEAARLLGRAPRLVPITMEGMPLRARRPQYCALSNAALVALGVPLPDWRDALRRSLQPVL